jgi:hypothetical protein
MVLIATINLEAFGCKSALPEKLADMMTDIAMGLQASARWSYERGQLAPDMISIKRNNVDKLDIAAPRRGAAMAATGSAGISGHAPHGESRNGQHLWRA